MFPRRCSLKTNRLVDLPRIVVLRAGSAIKRFNLSGVKMMATRKKGSSAGDSEMGADC